MSGSERRGPQREVDDVGDLVIADPARRAGAWLVAKTLQSVPGKAGGAPV